MTEHAIYCRPIVEADVTERYLSWFRDSDVIRFLEARNLKRDEVVAFMNAGRNQSRFMDAICLQSSGLHVGNVKIDVNWRHSLGELSIVVGDKSYWGKGVATGAITAMTQRAFSELGIRKLTAGVYAINLGSLKCFERAGWRIDAVSRDQLLLDGGIYDRIVMAAFNPQAWSTLPPSQR